MFASEFRKVSWPRGVLQWVATLALFVAFPIDLAALLARFAAEEQAHVNLVVILIYLLAGPVLDGTKLSSRYLLVQRSLVKGLRRNLGVAELPGRGEWYKYRGWKYMGSVAMPAAFVLVALDFIRGRTANGVLGLKLFLYGCAVAYLVEEPYVVFYNYLHAPFQMMALSLIPGSLPVARRAILVRLLCSITIFEGLDKIVLSLVPLAVWTSDFSFAITLASLSFVLMEVLGLRATIAIVGHSFMNKYDPKENLFRLDKKLHFGLAPYAPRMEQVVMFSICMVPSVTMAASLGAGVPLSTHEVEVSNAKLGAMFAAGFLLLAPLLATFRRILDERLQPNVVRKRNKAHIHQEQVQGYNDGTASLYAAWGVTVGALISLGLRHPSFGSLLCVSAAVWFVLGKYLDWARMVERAGVAASPALAALWILHVALIGYFGFADTVAFRSNIAVVLALVRGLATIDATSSVGESCSALCLISGLYIMALRTSSSRDGILHVSIVACSSLFLTVAAAVVREARVRVVEVVRNSEAYLDHAIKQRYSGVGAALESILECKALASTSSPLKSTIRSALAACNAGRDMCHLTTSASKLLSDPERLGHLERVTLEDILDEWSDAGVFGSIDISKQLTGGEWSIDTNRDLLRSLLCSFSNELSTTTLHVSLASSESLERLQRVHKFISIPGVADCPVLEFHIASGWDEHAADCDMAHVSKSSAHNATQTGTQQGMRMTALPTLSGAYLQRVRKVVANALRGTIHERSLYVAVERCGGDRKVPPELYVSPISSVLRRLRASKPLGDSVVTPVRRPLSHQGHPAYPIAPGLTFAVLDDVPLVRSNVLRMVLIHASGNLATSFACGHTLAEARSFAQRIVAHKVDVAILDEHLEFDDGKIMLSGTEIGAMARAAGFKGCLILHSANGDLHEGLDTCFDGFIEKTSKRDDFLRALHAAWHNSLMHSSE